MKKFLLILICSLFTITAVGASFSASQREQALHVKDTVLQKSNKNPAGVKTAILTIKEILQNNYMSPTVVTVFELAIRELVPYMQCPILDCVASNPLCSYNNPIIDDQGCYQSCGELECSCDRVSCIPVPEYCEYKDKKADAQGCLIECGSVSCVCPIVECPDDDNCYERKKNEFGCVESCERVECPLV